MNTKMYFLIYKIFNRDIDLFYCGYVMEQL